jgi:predicted Zn-dependent protease with MMP-like domain
LQANDVVPGKAIAELKKLMAWRRIWPHLTRRRRLYFRASQPSTLEEFEIAARAIWEGLPEQFREGLDNVTLSVANFADAETLQAMRIRDPLDLLGLYQGAGLPSKSVWDPVSLPDRIFLYRIPIVDYARRGGQRVERVIRHVLIHEIGHHFGFSDVDMARIEAGA